MEIVSYKIRMTGCGSVEEFNSQKEATKLAAELDKGGDGFVMYAVTECGNSIVMEY